ncbi:hypothetical protein [Marinilabilia rubra]|uniref:Uncharacterized protein n=1 Tax=Marinilabilia rubra TaxID=2162893 RepID=A0A2U2B9G9_9BACT|nr:hypothetical protein [Marinilabilia rubra]PWD99693.1 hypothetical protein DDZ16_09620 [Marinilabilia rubra]
MPYPFFQSVFNRQKSSKTSSYVQFDETYSVWRLGYTLGMLYETISLSELGVPGFSGKYSLSDRIRDFLITHEIFCNHTSIFSAENKYLKQHLEKIENGGSPEVVVKEIFVLKRIYETKIKAFSTHLSNIFKFGFQFNVAKTSFLCSGRSSEEIELQLSRLYRYIDLIDQGDKNLESTNLEISAINLKIFKKAVLLLGKWKNDLISVAGSDIKGFYQLINNRIFGVLRAIILDIQNPIQILRSKFLLYLIYYYSIVTFLALIELFIEFVLANNQLSFDFLGKFGFNEGILTFLVYAIPATISLLMLLHLSLKRIIVNALIARRFNKEIKKYLNQIKDK